MKSIRLIAVFLCAASFLGVGMATPSSEGSFDIVLQGGRVIDPESRLDAIRDIGIRDGRIVAISEAPLHGALTVDVENMVVSPGFIDLHAHGQYPGAQEIQAFDGVTTAIDMEGGTWPVAKHYSRREGRMLLNWGVSSSHGCARLKALTGADCPDRLVSDEAGRVMSSEITHATLSSSEQSEVARLLASDIDSGALGIGMGIDYTPGASRSEIYEMFKVAARRHVPVHVHLRRRPADIAKGMGIAVAQEVIANAALTGAPLQIVHLTSTATQGDVPVLLDMLAKARLRGIDVTTEIYPYTAATTAIGSAIFDEGWRQNSTIDYNDLQWAATGERLNETSFNRYRTSEPRGNVVAHFIPEADVRIALAHPNVSIASDGMWWVTNGEHPRGAGTFARVLGRYTREQRIIDLPTAIAKMTIMPARRLENVSMAMRRKGRIRVGADADIVVFDPATIADNATFENPMRKSTGVRQLLVNGRFVLRDGRLVPGVFPGEAIKRDVAALSDGADAELPR